MEIGLRRCGNVNLLVHAFIGFAIERVPASYIRQVCLTAVASNVGLANPLLFVALATMKWPTSEADEAGEVDMTGYADIISILAANQNVSLDVVRLCDICSMLICQPKYCKSLFGRPTRTLYSTARMTVRTALSKPSAHTFEESVIFFAFLMFADAAWLTKLLDVYCDAYRNEISDGWQVATAAVMAELKRRPTVAYFVFAYVLLMTRNELEFGDEIVTDVPPASIALRRTLSDVIGPIATKTDQTIYPRCVYGIKSITGRMGNRTGEDYLSSELHTTVQVTVKSDVLACLENVHTRMVTHHFERFEWLVNNYRNRWSKRERATQSQLRDAKNTEDNEMIGTLTAKLNGIKSHLTAVESMPTLYCHCPPLYDIAMVTQNILHIISVAKSYD
jgi:hypothetical protein